MRITSFGYLHGGPPPAHITIDARDLFRDPHVDPVMRQMTGRDQAVIDNVVTQPGAHWTTLYLADILRSLASLGVDAHLAIGCAGGRHLSVVLADVIASRLGVVAEHRDIDKPVVERTTGDVS